MRLYRTGLISLVRLMAACTELPSERRLSRSKETQGINRPGCTAADEALIVHGHLEGLAKGWGGFGVMRTSAERMEQAVKAARQAGSEDVATKFELVRLKLPEVRTPEKAAEVAKELEEVLPAAWNLGKRCKGEVTPEMWQKAKALADKVKAGEITKGQALSALRSS